MSDFLCVHTRTNHQTVTCWTKVFSEKKKKKLMKGYSPRVKYRSRRLYTKFLNKIFINMYQYLLRNADMVLLKCG